MSESILPESEISSYKEEYRVALKVSKTKRVFSKPKLKSLPRYELTAESEEQIGNNNSGVITIFQLARYLIGLIVFALLVFATFYFIQNFSNNLSSKTQNAASFDHLSSSIIGKLNLSVDPCENFFKFACGAWIQESFPTISTTHWNVVVATGIKALNELSLYLDNLMADPSTMVLNKAEKKAVALYTSCINENRMREVGMGPWLSLMESLGGWSPQAKFNPQPLEKFMGNLMYEKGSYALLWIGSLINEQNSSKFSITVDEPIPILIYANIYSIRPVPVTAQKIITGECSEFLKAIYEMSIHIAVDLLKNEPSVDLNTSIAEMIEFEWKIVMTSSVINRDASSRPFVTNLGHLNRLANFVNWTLILQEIYDEKFDDTEVIVISRGTEWLIRSTALLQEYQATIEGKRTIENYLKFRAALLHLQYISQPCKEQPWGMQLYFERILQNIAFNGQRRLYCLLRTSAILPIAFASIFRKIKPEREKENRYLVEVIQKEIKAAMVSEFQKSDKWLDEEIRSFSIRKLKNMGSLISFPDLIFNTTAMEQEVEELVVDRRDMFWSMVNASRFLRIKNLRRLRKPAERFSWIDNATPLTINALYNFERNMIILPMMITRAPFLDISSPRVMNYASIGSIIGHEMFHGFDKKGILYNEYGNLMNGRNNILQNFEKQASCFIDQYKNFINEGYKIDAIETLNENIADNAGLLVAYKAWKFSDDQSHPTGTEFDQNQLFFIAYAQTWCSKRVNSDMTFNDVHSTDSLRVIGPLQNFKAFAEAFQCPINSPMNPKTKCSIW